MPAAESFAHAHTRTHKPFTLDVVAYSRLSFSNIVRLLVHIGFQLICIAKCSQHCVCANTEHTANISI